MNSIKGFVYKNIDCITIICLGILFYFLFFHNIGSYPLMDVDETRYVLMSKDMFHSKDFLTLYLNNEYFFEKPPLYFWCECLSFYLFRNITEFTARFPVALFGCISAYFTYFMCKKVHSRIYGIISSLILATSMEFLILSKFAILDIVVSTCIWFSLCFGIITYICRESHKKYYWWLFYIFSGLAVMAKGIPGVIIPFGSMFFISLYFRNFKEILKPKYFLVGIALFFLITLPWHVIMLNIHSPLFFDEYIMKHHIMRFIGGNKLGREQPFYFYLVTLLWGFFPWVYSSVAVLIRKIKNREFVFTNLTKLQEFMVCNGIIVIFSLVFFSLSDTKLITYILPIYGSLACLSGYVWYEFIKENKYEKLIYPSVKILGWIFVLVSIIAIFTPLYLPKTLYQDIYSAKHFCISLCFAFGLASVLFGQKHLKIGIFITYVTYMLILSAFGTQKLFDIDYKFGQYDLMKYAKYAKEHNLNITTFNFNNKYSLNFYSDQKVNFNLENDLNKLNTEKELIIIEYKNINVDEIDKSKYNIINTGRKYMLLESK